MERRLVPIHESWEKMRSAFHWDVPARFNIAERCCDSWASEDPDKLAIIDASDGDKHWSFGALKDASDKLATVFRLLGVEQGDRVAVLLPQGPAVMIAHFAAYKLGAVVLPLFTLFGADALEYRLADSGTKLAVTDREGAEKLAGLRHRLPELVDVISLDGGPARAFWEDIAAAPALEAPVNTRADDPAVLIYTSGTTGPPKGVLHAHRFLMGHLPSVELHHRFFPQPGDCGWTPADWAWIGGLMDLAMPCLYYGVPLVSRRMRKFDPTEAWDLIARHNIRNLFLPPTALKMMRLAPVPEGVNIRSIGSGGESLGSELLQWGREKLGTDISEIYGQTECNLVIASVPGLMAARPGAMGLPVPGFDVAVLRADGAVAAPDELGEICVRRGTPVMFLEYWGKPEKTAEKFMGDWLRTGDLGTCGAEGLFTYVSRDDDVITSAGYRIGPSEIENCLLAHPDVATVAVVGQPDPERTEIVVAHVVLREGAQWEGLEDALKQLVRDRVSPHVAPRKIIRADSLPMTATGKILRRALRG
ncbi:AMP-binding protein [Actibacterium lipolyticum]|uniref:Acetyl-coenzyme A synthetase n=1 Tax=Actibacterium lipolyticum TaxID=1524263 RepID=A0A238JV33_9RHOB|nr:AMP-binding protein [Actibacterium lipolyticum]SMX34034.1 Acetyl-coenzyme A synthetase [Actibacterium lipolyticum]